MLYGRRLDDALDHVDDSRYALVHAVSKRARQITLWLTADPAELRAEAAPPPAPGELSTRDPVSLAEQEILQDEVRVLWNPEGVDEAEQELLDADADPLLTDGIGDDEEDLAAIDLDSDVTPALAQALDGDEATEANSDADEAIGEDVLEDADDDDLDAENEDEDEDEIADDD